MVVKEMPMFAIALKQEQYKTYILSDQMAQSRLEVVPERGGIITQWAVRGQEILYLDAQRFTNPELTVRGGIPILFPICGNITNHTYTYKGQSYTLKQHGFARDLSWEVSDRITQEFVGITLTLTSNDTTRDVYPFDFKLAFAYRLQGNSLEIHQQITNQSAEIMPFSMGLHPYFLVTDKSQLQFDIPATQFFSHQDQTTYAFNGSFDFEQDEIDILFQEPSRPSATVTDSSRQLQIRLSYESPYTKLVFWTVKGKDFYCLEPWSAPRNAINTGDRLTHLEPGATLETSVHLTVSFL
jgi:galactose mutarotase-like enzyme